MSRQYKQGMDDAMRVLDGTEAKGWKPWYSCGTTSLEELSRRPKEYAIGYMETVWFEHVMGEVYGRSSLVLP